MDVSGARMVVTGAGHGIGRAIVARMAAGGARVVVNDIDAGAARAVAAGTGGYAVPGDAASQEGVTALIDAARDRLGGIDAYFSNAGVGTGRGLAAPDADWMTSIEVNLLAHVRAARLLVPGWAASGGGRLVIIASAAGLLTMLGLPAYSATKHAAVAFAEWLSATYRHRGVVVQVICPQGVKTRMLDGSGPLRELLSHDTALEPAQVADAVWQGLQDDRFLILPHPQVQGYYEHRAAHTDTWLAGMNKLQRRLEEAGGLW